MINVQINKKAYDAICEMRFDIIDILQIYGVEVWENNSDLCDKFSEREVRDAFVQHILDQKEVAERFNPIFI